ncbi:D-alanyl-D-alanine carboxypeptidase [Escherichia coli]
MTQRFSAPPAAAIVDRNCFSVSLYSAPKPGDMAFIRVASYYPVTMFSQVRTLPRFCRSAILRTGCRTRPTEPLYADGMPATTF